MYFCYFLLHQFSYYVLTVLILFIYVCILNLAPVFATFHPPDTRFANRKPQTDESVFPGLRVQFWITNSLKALWLIQTFPAWTNGMTFFGKRRLFFHEMNETLNEMTQRPFDDISKFCLDCFLLVVVQTDSLHEKMLSRKRLVSSRKKRHAAVNHRDPQIRPPSTAKWSCEMFANNSDRVGDQPASSQSFWSQHTSWWCFPRSLAQLNSASHLPSYIRLKQNTNIQVFLSTPSPQSKKYDDLNLDFLKSICNDFWNVPRISLFQRSCCHFCCFPVLLQMTRFHCFLLNWEGINWLCWCFNKSAYRSPFKCSLSRVRIDHDRS